MYATYYFPRLTEYYFNTLEMLIFSIHMMRIWALWENWEDAADVFRKLLSNYSTLGYYSRGHSIKSGLIKKEIILFQFCCNIVEYILQKRG